jgi:hypothetical protein
MQSSRNAPEEDQRRNQPDHPGAPKKKRHHASNHHHAQKPQKASMIGFSERSQHDIPRNRSF